MYKNNKPIIVADAATNHGGDIDVAKENMVMKKRKFQRFLFLILPIIYPIADLFFLGFLKDFSFILAFILWILLFINLRISFKYFVISALVLCISLMIFASFGDFWFRERAASWLFFLLLFGVVFSVFERDSK